MPGEYVFDVTEVHGYGLRPVAKTAVGIASLHPLIKNGRLANFARFITDIPVSGSAE